MYNSGPNVVAEVFKAGEAAGLRAGDTIVAINGQFYTSFDELFFKNIRHAQPGSVNTYTVRRDGKTLDLSLTTGRLGLAAVLWRSGALFGIGLVYVVIGALVFLMKPHATESWLFFVMTCCIGMVVSYSAPSDLIHPLWFYNVRGLLEVLLPAPVIHLALKFPKTRTFLRQKPWLSMVPYLLSLSLFSLMRLTSTVYWNIPPTLYLLMVIYTMLGVLIFLTGRKAARLEVKRWQAISNANDVHFSMYEQMLAEDKQVKLTRKIPKVRSRLDRLLGFRDRLSSAKGRLIPYVIGAVDTTAVWLLDKLSVVNTEALVASIKNIFA